MGIIRVGAAGKRGAEPCVGTGGKDSRAATLLSLPVGTRLVLALSHAWRPSLGCWRCSWPSSARQGCRDVDSCGSHLAVDVLVVCSAGRVLWGLLRSSRASTSVCLVILTDSRRGSIPKCGCILPWLRGYNLLVALALLHQWLHS